MKLVHRFAYYFGGFTIGIVLLLFFLSGKKTSCAYGPEARTLKNIRNKDHDFSEETLQFLKRRKTRYISNFKNTRLMEMCCLMKKIEGLTLVKFIILKPRFQKEILRLPLKTAMK